MILGNVLGFEDGNRMENDGWGRICNALRGMVSADAYQRWFRASRWLGADGGCATVGVPNEIHQVWIETNFLPN